MLHGKERGPGERKPTNIFEEASNKTEEYLRAHPIPVYLVQTTTPRTTRKDIPLQLTTTGPNPSPPPGKKWLFNTLFWRHITGGGGSRILISNSLGNIVMDYHLNAAESTGYFNMDLGLDVNPVMYPGDTWTITGEALSYGNLRCLEVDDI